MRTILIINPTSGSSLMAHHEVTPQQVEETILNCLQSHDIEPEVWHTTEEDAGDGLARRAASEGADLVIAAGGDGTIHAVASGLIGSKTVLGIIATGTMNNLAHSLSIPETIESACNIAAKGMTKRIDIGNINDQVFLEVAGIGIEAVLFPAAEEIKKYGILTTIRGIYDGLKALFSFKPMRVRVSFDGRKSRVYHALQVTVCNSPYYGVHLQVAPGTRMDDGLLDVVIYRNFSKFEFLRHSISIAQGRRVLEPKLTRRKVQTLSVLADHPVPLHADGVEHGCTPAFIAVTPGALHVRVPQEVVEEPERTSFEPGHRSDRYHAIRQEQRLKRERQKMETRVQQDRAEHERSVENMQTIREELKTADLETQNTGDLAAGMPTEEGIVHVK
jgi:diacylglycerol kinase (ATP)